jgi:outer membrane protein
MICAACRATRMKTRSMRPSSPLLMLAALALAGCATSALDMAPPSAESSWTPMVTSNGAIQPGPAGPGGNSYLLPPNPSLAILPPPPAIDPNRAYGLPGLIDIAEANSPQTRIAWDAARNAALAAGITESLYLPNLTASALGAVQGFSGHESGLGETVSGNNGASGGISALSLNWLLFDFGERGALVEAAKQTAIVSNIAFTAAHQQLIYNVSLAYYAYVAARAHNAAAAQSLANAQAVQVAAAARYQRGIGTVMDVTQAVQGTAQANLALVQARGATQDSYLALLTAMGVSPLTQLQVADPAPRQFSQDLGAPVQQIVTQALARRPDMLGAYAAEQASLAKVQAARAEFLPKFFLSATGSYSSAGLDVTALPAVGQQQGTVNLSGNHLGGTILAGITVPLYDGGTRAALLDQAENDSDSAQAALAAARDATARQVVSADDGLQTSLAAYTAAQAVSVAAQTSYDAAFAAYQHGTGSITALLLAQTQLLQARNAASDAYYAVFSAAATLAFTTGALGAAPA